MQVGHVPHIDDAEGQSRAARYSSVHQPPKQLNGRRKVRPEHRSEHHDRVDHGEFERTALAGDEFPRRALREGLRFHIGAEAAVWVGPIRFGKRAVPGCMTVTDRGKRGGEHQALDARVARRTQHPQRAVARRNDEFVLVLWRARGKG